MIDLLKKIFLAKQFEVVQDDAFTLFKYSNSSGKVGFWILIEADINEVLDEQSDLFNSCKELLNSVPEFDKNATLVAIHQSSDESNLIDYKYSILQIEENPYLFKKHVLIYTQNELDALSEQLGGVNEVSKFEELLSGQSTFREYKDSFGEYSWQALLYRIALKIPIIDVHVERDEGLASLVTINSQAIKDSGLEDFGKNVTDGLKDLDNEGIDALRLDEIKQFLKLEYDGIEDT